MHFLRMRVYWPSDPKNRSVWERLDVISPVHKMRHNLAADLHVFGSYVTGHLPRAHPLVVDTTHDDRALEGIWFDNELNTPNFLMWSFKHKKVYTMSDPRHFDTILPFLQPGDVGHKIDLTAMTLKRCIRHPSLVCISVPTTVIQSRSRSSSSLSPVSSTLTPSSDSGENIPLPDQGEQGKQADDVPPEKVIQYL